MTSVVSRNHNSPSIVRHASIGTFDRQAENSVMDNLWDRHVMLRTTIISRTEPEPQSHGNVIEANMANMVSHAFSGLASKSTFPSPNNDCIVIS